MEREFMFSIVPSYKEEKFLSVHRYVCKATLYVSATLEKITATAVYHFFLNCCTLSFPLNMFVLAVSPLINIKLLAICEIK